ncbi:MAG TPA: long-chain fatty acid--CoA ligase [Dehalococcoidia bacterium]|nr:long-chain fatty acid--CoA ligase [Dehalococcoidia bacterium]
MNLVQMLENAARKYGDKTAITMGERRVSYNKLEETSNRVASALIKLGVEKGDRVATMQSSNPEFVTVFFGILKVGAIAVPLDSRYVADELDRLFRDCQPRVLVADNPPLASLVPALPRFDSIKHIITIDPELDGRFISYNQIVYENPAEPVVVNIEPNDPATISYTGGPTQDPHGVILSHQSICTEAITSGDVLNQTEKDVLIGFALPMYHQFGLVSVLLGSIVKGSTLVVVPGTGRSIHSFMEAVEKEKGTIYMGVPYIYALMINVARKEGVNYNLSSLRACLSGGAPLPVEVIQLFKQYFNLNLLDIWGQTETVSHATVSPIDGTGPIGASGRAMPCWEMKIFDENDSELPPNQEGEIVIRGPVMTSFYNKPEATTRILRNGWLHTGDIGYIDEEGNLFITARKRIMLILKGQNIFPRDIEEVLNTHPKIAESRIVGTIDILRGETVKALVRLKSGETATEQEIRQYCQGRMADYKLPREVEFVEKIPATTPNWRRPKSQEISGLKL